MSVMDTSITYTLHVSCPGHYSTVFMLSVHFLMVGRRLSDGAYVQPRRGGLAAALALGNSVARNLVRKASGVPWHKYSKIIKPMVPALQKGLKGVVTRQSDFNASTSRTFVGKKKYVKRLRRVRRRINRIIKKHYRLTVWVNYGRSWLYSAQNSGVTELWLWSHRGAANISNGDVLNAANPGNTKHTTRQLAVAIKGLLDNEVFYPTGAAANTAQPNWWWKQGPCVLDVTMTNAGGSGAETSTARGIEYEVYKITCINRPPRDPSGADTMNNYVDLKNYLQNRFAQGLGSNVNSTIAAGDAGFAPYIPPFVKNYLDIKLVGRGQLPLGDTVRFNVSHNPKLFYHKRAWDDESTAGDAIDTSWVKGACQLMVVSRGLPLPGIDPNLQRHRLIFQVNWRGYLKSHSVGQENQRGLHKFADDYQIPT